MPIHSTLNNETMLLSSKRSPTSIIPLTNQTHAFTFYQPSINSTPTNTHICAYFSSIQTRSTPFPHYYIIIAETCTLTLHAHQMPFPIHLYFPRGCRAVSSSDAYTSCMACYVYITHARVSVCRYIYVRPASISYSRVTFFRHHGRNMVARTEPYFRASVVSVPGLRVCMCGRCRDRMCRKKGRGSIGVVNGYMI